MDDEQTDVLAARCRATDQAEQFGAAIYFPHRLTVLERDRPFEMDIRAMQFGPIMVAVLRYSSEVLIETDDLETSYEVNVPLRGRFLSRSGSDEVVADPGTAAVYRPYGATSFRGFADGGELVGVKIDRAALERQLADVARTEFTGPLALRPSLDLTSGPGLDWWCVARALVDLLGRPDGLVTNKLITRPLAKSVLTSLLYALDHPQVRSLLEEPATVAPSAIKLAVDLLEDQPEEPWTVPELASRCGVSVRTLQDGFRRAAGTTPTAHLRAVRLRRAHSELAVSDPSCATVADIAYRWGFSHLGRFAAAYAREYGEAPSTTLRSD